MGFMGIKSSVLKNVLKIFCILIMDIYVLKIVKFFIKEWIVMICVYKEYISLVKFVCRIVFWVNYIIIIVNVWMFVCIFWYKIFVMNSVFMD